MEKTLNAGLGMSLVSVALLALSGPGTRWGWWDFDVGLLVLVSSSVAGLIGAILCAIAWRRAPATTRFERVAALGTTVGAAVFILVEVQVAMAVTKPPIHDVSTDLADPPRFSAVLASRERSANRIDRLDPQVAAQQRAAYPDLQPLILSMPADAAFQVAVAEAKNVGWEVVSARPEDRTFEATARTKWFGFRDDVVVRVRPKDTGSRVDVRSASRVGEGDAGANAARIRGYLDRLRDENTHP